MLAAERLRFPVVAGGQPVLDALMLPRGVCRSSREGTVVGSEQVAAGRKMTASRLTARLGQRRKPHPASGRRAGRLRSFDPARVADLECRAWVSYYRRDWPQLLMAFVALIRAGFGMDWCRTLHAAWLIMRATQLWAPIPGNDPGGARACMRRFYALVRLSCGEPASPAEAARLEVDWWRVHREAGRAAGPRGAGDELVESLTRLYSYLYGEPADDVRPAAMHRARAMDLSDEWVDEGCRPDSPLLAREHAALVRGYAALLAAVHH
jgi:hypothetical protein